MTTIVFVHPWHGSFNKAILDVIINKYIDNNIEYQLIDLNKDNFNPVLTEHELSDYNKGKYTDPLVGKYIEMIKKTDKIIFIFPIWWHTMPAILKGFFDKVLLFDFAFNYQNGWNPLLTIKQSFIITTSSGDTERFKSSIEGEIIPNMLQSVGIDNTKWYNCDEISNENTADKRKEFLATIKNEI